MNFDEFSRVSELLAAEKAEEALEMFRLIKPEQSVKYFLVKGKLNQKFQLWGEAINAFSNVVELDPDNIEAKNNLQIIRNILNFWSPEMFNP